jgi:hypothetical protein
MVMSHLVDKDSLARANSALLLTIVGGGLAACAVGAVIYDLGKLISIW